MADGASVSNPKCRGAGVTPVDFSSEFRKAWICLTRASVDRMKLAGRVSHEMQRDIPAGLAALGYQPCSIEERKIKPEEIVFAVGEVSGIVRRR